MPQLDKFIFSSQFFWLFFLLLLSYFLLVRYSLPALLQTLKFRKLKLGSLTLTADSLLLLLSSRTGWVGSEGGRGFVLPTSALFETSFFRFHHIEQELGSAIKSVATTTSPLLVPFPSPTLQGVDLTGGLVLLPVLLRNRLFRLLPYLKGAPLPICFSSVVAFWISFPLLVESATPFNRLNPVFSPLPPFVGGVESGLLLLLLHKYSMDLYLQLQFAFPTGFTPLFRLEQVLVPPVELAFSGVGSVGY